MDRWLQVLSTMATQPLEDVAKAGKDGPLQLFQLYVIKDRAFCRRLIQRKHPSPVQCRLVTRTQYPYDRVTVPL